MFKIKYKKFILTFLILMFFSLRFIQIQANNTVVNLPEIQFNNKEFIQKDNESIFSYSIKTNGNEIYAINIDFEFVNIEEVQYRVEYTDLVKNWLSAENTTINGQIRVALASSDFIEKDGILLRLIFEGDFKEDLKITKLIINDNEIKIKEVEDAKEVDNSNVEVIDPGELKPIGSEQDSSSEMVTISGKSAIYIESNSELLELINTTISKDLEVFFTDENLIISKEVLELLSIQQRNLILYYTNKNGEAEYSWRIKGEFIQNVFDFKVGVLVNNINDKELEKKFSKYKSIILFKTLQDGVFPNKSEFSIYVGDVFLDNKMLILSSFDKEVTLINESIIVNHGYVDLNLSSTNIYLLSDSEIKDNTILNLILYSIVFLTLTFSIIYFLKVKKKKK